MIQRRPLILSAAALAGLATLGLLGFIAAMLGGLWVLISVWRGGR